MQRETKEGEKERDGYLFREIGSQELERETERHRGVER